MSETYLNPQRSVREQFEQLIMEALKQGEFYNAKEMAKIYKELYGESKKEAHE